MKALLFVFSLFLIISGLSLFTKSHNKTTEKMGNVEHLALSVIAIIGGLWSMVSSQWFPGLFAILFIWIIYGINEKKRLNRASISEDAK